MSGGYGEFMRSDEGLDTRSTTMATMNETFEKKKNELDGFWNFAQIMFKN